MGIVEHQKPRLFALGSPQNASKLLLSHLETNLPIYAPFEQVW